MAPASWTHWADGEPDGGQQHCAMVWGGHGYAWADLGCDQDTSSGGHNILALCELGPGPASHSVLWLGNSYTWRNDVPGLVTALASADGFSLHTESHAESSWTWKLHASSDETLSKIRSRKWDTVVLQEQSERPAQSAEVVCENSVPYLDILAKEILDNNPDTMIQFYLTWGRPHGDQEECDNGLTQFCSYSKMQDALTNTYSDFACMKAVSRVAPVGEAFRYIHDTESQSTFLSLYADNGGDHHASMAGSYLSAATHYAAMLNTSVVGNTGEVEGLDTDTITMLQRVASDTWFSGQWTLENGCQQCLCGC